MKKIFVSVIFTLLAAGCAQQPATSPTPQPVACTQEAKECPDGSYVGRTGPNCEFAACPTSPNPIPTPVTPPPALNSGVEGTITVGPTCPVERIPPDLACADKPYQAIIKVETPDGKKQISQTTSGTDGKFKISLQPGSYLLVAESGSALPRTQSQSVTVEKNKYATVNIVLDSGIR